ncbi:MAG: type III-B CRISPR module-associated Cmr3 family protein [Verrucomicrobiia bacterium]
MNTILLQPIDVLFFRDGRPMEGSLAGHGAAFPLPTVINGAFHAALHRAGFTEVHLHRRGKSGRYDDKQRDRKYGCLKTAGPFPVRLENEGENNLKWYFPRPLDLTDKTLSPTLLPTDMFDSLESSLPDPLEYAVASIRKPEKESDAKNWLSMQAFEKYVNGEDLIPDGLDAANDSDFSEAEHSIGIAIDPESGTTGGEEAAGKIYSAHYLRLKEEWRLGVFAEAKDKDFNHTQYGNDLVKALLNGEGKLIIVGGQQRMCTARMVEIEGSRLPLPYGKANSFNQYGEKYLVKWILLTPAVYPEIPNDESKGIKYHPGGWLPNWIDTETGRVLLKAGDTERRESESREEWRKRVRELPTISARLVAALVPKPVVVTGWAIGDENAGEKAGAMSAHLAVPAGSIYYFEADSEEDATNLANALNWHDRPDAKDFGKTIKNCRSTLLGEKGFGLGVCGTFTFFSKSNSEKGHTRTS